MKTRKLLSLVLVLAFCMAMLAGCGSSNPSTEPSASSAPEGSSATQTNSGSDNSGNKVYKVAFLPTDMSMTFASWLARELEIAFKAYDDMELTIIDSKNVLETQISALETCVAQGYDYIILLPIEPEATDDLVADYIDKGTPIMNINLDSLQVEKASSVIANPYDLGTVVAEYAKTLLPEDANVVILLGPSGNRDSIERRRAYEDIILSKNPNITILDEQIGDWEKSKGMEFMENWLQVYDDIDAVLSMNDAMAIGAIEAAKDAGKDKDILFFGVDGLADAALSIEAGDLDGTALQDAKVMAEEAARIVHEVLTGKNQVGYEKVQIPVTLITSKNVDEFIERYKENGLLK